MNLTIYFDYFRVLTQFNLSVLFSADAKSVSILKCLRNIIFLKF